MALVREQDEVVGLEMQVGEHHWALRVHQDAGVDTGEASRTRRAVREEGEEGGAASIATQSVTATGACHRHGATRRHTVVTVGGGTAAGGEAGDHAHRVRARLPLEGVGHDTTRREDVLEPSRLSRTLYFPYSCRARLPRHLATPNHRA